MSLLGAACGEIPPVGSRAQPQTAIEGLPTGVWSGLTPNPGPEPPLDKPATVLPLADGNALIAGGATVDDQGRWSPSTDITLVTTSTGTSRTLPRLPGTMAVVPLGAAGTAAEPMILVNRCTLTGDQGGCDLGTTTVSLLRLKGRSWRPLPLPESVTASPNRVAWGPKVFQIAGSLAVVVATRTDDDVAWIASMSSADRPSDWSPLDLPPDLHPDAINFGDPFCATQDHLVSLTVPATRDPSTSTVQIGDLRPSESIGVTFMDPTGHWSPALTIDTPSGLGFGHLACTSEMAIVKVNTVPSAYVSATPGDTKLTLLDRPDDRLDDPIHAALVTGPSDNEVIVVSVGGDGSAAGILRGNRWLPLPAPAHAGVSPRAIASPAGLVLRDGALVDLRQFLDRPRSGRAYALRLDH